MFVKRVFFYLFFPFHLVLAQLLFCRLKLNREEKWKKLLSLFSISSQREAPYLENDDFSWKKNLIWWCSLCQFCNYLSFQINMHGSIFFSMRIVNAQCGSMKNTLSPKLICQNQHFNNFISANKIAFTKFLKKKTLWRVFVFATLCSSKITLIIFNGEVTHFKTVQKLEKFYHKNSNT